jgi:hypothetical protein
MTPSGKVQKFVRRRDMEERAVRELGNAEQESGHG